MDDLTDIAMKVEGVWLPKGEQHMLEWMTTGKGARRIGPDNKITYQWEKQKAAMKVFDNHMPGWNNGVFVDVGGHCGFWSMWWGLRAEGIVAFEPIRVLRHIYEANVRGNGVHWGRVHLLPFALSDKPGKMPMQFNPANTGATRAISPKDAELQHPYVAEVETLNRALPGALQGRRMSVLKIDCEGFEEKVLSGGLAQIKQHRPCIICEQKFESEHFDFAKEGAVKLLHSIGYTTVRVMSGDHIMVPA